MGRPLRGVLEGPKVGLERWADRGALSKKFAELKHLEVVIFGLLRNKLLQDDVVSFPVSLVSM